MAKPIKTGADLWASFDEIDAMLEVETTDIKRVEARINNNRQRIAFLSLAFQAGALTPSTLQLPQLPETAVAAAA